VTGLLKDGENYVVIAVDSTRLADGIPTLQTDWWNYGGLTRDVGLVELPEQFIDDFDLHLKRGSQSTLDLEGWVHVEGVLSEAEVTVRIPELKVNETAKVGPDGRAKFQFEVSDLERWSPEHPRLYRVNLQAGHDRLEDEMGFRTIEVQGTRCLIGADRRPDKNHRRSARRSARCQRLQ
jgi:beta-glucuronidase